MTNKNTNKRTFIMDLERLNTYNAQGCPACGQKFNLGDTVVAACGTWDGKKFIHESEAVFDEKISAYVDRKCFTT
ncbi:MAG: hypothetical protein P8012_15975 [Desulfobacterales bacterium]